LQSFLNISMQSPVAICYRIAGHDGHRPVKNR
jgi:hypothetical protein